MYDFLKVKKVDVIVCFLDILVGSISNGDGDGDGNENVKKAISLLSKTTTLHVHHSFSYISLPSPQGAEELFVTLIDCS